MQLTPHGRSVALSDHPSPAGATTIGEKMSVSRTEAPPLVGTLACLLLLVVSTLTVFVWPFSVSVTVQRDRAGQAGKDPRHRSDDTRRNEESERVGRAAVDQDFDAAVSAGGRPRHGLDHFEVATNRLERTFPAERRGDVFHLAEWLPV